MKNLEDCRTSNKFTLMGIDVDRLVFIHQWCKDRRFGLCAVHQLSMSEYIVRVVVGSTPRTYDLRLGTTLDYTRDACEIAFLEIEGRRGTPCFPVYADGHVVDWFDTEEDAASFRRDHPETR